MKRHMPWIACVAIVTGVAIYLSLAKEVANEPTVSTIPESLIVPSIAEAALSPIEARKAVKAGDTVVLTGNIAGRKAPFVENRAMFILSGMELPTCDATCESSCPTPWDLCCQTPDTIMQHAATVQVVDTQGHVLKETLQGHRGLAPGARIQVKGKVMQSDAHVFLINAESIAFPK